MNREGVCLLLFDLPASTRLQKRAYICFRKALRRAGYRQLQKSVYVKDIRSTASVSSEAELLRQTAPAEGSVLLLPMTLGQFQALITVRGEAFDFTSFCSPMVIY